MECQAKSFVTEKFGGCSLAARCTDSLRFNSVRRASAKPAFLVTGRVQRRGAVWLDSVDLIRPRRTRRSRRRGLTGRRCVRVIPPVLTKSRDNACSW